MTIDQYFQNLLASLSPTQAQIQNIRTTRAQIDDVLRKHPRLYHVPGKPISFLTGSYRRNTIIRPIDDIDLYVRVHYGLHANGKPPIQVLSVMSAALRSRFSQTRIRRDTPCIVLNFTGLGYKFEVVPVVTFSDSEDLHLVPGPRARQWIECYPNVPTKWLTDSNYANDGKFIPLIKLLKNWNRNNNVGLKSFHLELLTEMVFSEISEVWSYPQGVYEWMYHVSRWISGSNVPFVLEPGKDYTYVDKYLYERKPTLFRVRKNLKAGLRQGQLAYYSYLDNKEGKACLLYQKMFSKKSPLPSVATEKRPPAFPPRLPALPSPTRAMKSFSLADLLSQPPSTNALSSLFDRPVVSPPKIDYSSLLAELLRSDPKKPWS